MTTSPEKQELENEVRMLRGSLEALAQADPEVGCPKKMAAVASEGLRESRKRVVLTEATESRSLIGSLPNKVEAPDA